MNGARRQEKILERLERHWTELCEVVRVFRVNGYAMSIYRPALFKSKREQPFLVVRNECRVPLGQDHNKKKEEKEKEKENQVMAQHRPKQPCTRRFLPKELFMHLNPQ
jgi:hypothetical protein